MRLRLYENYRFLLYTPFYAAHAIGAYQAQGLEVELLASPGPGRAETALIAGDADVIWAGPMRIIKHHDLHPDSPLVCIAEVVCRDPFSIVGREPRPDFRLADLASLRFASVAEVPTPWLCLQEDLRQAGIDPDGLNRIGERSMADSLAALRAGGVDAVQCFEPFVEQALRNNGGHLWYAASGRGRTSYTALVATRERLASDPELLLRLVRAIYQTQRWVQAASPAEIAAAIAGFFPDNDLATLEGAIARYRLQAVWGTDPILPQEGFERLRQGLISSGFVGREVPFNSCVDNRLAEQAVH
jgi:NitT/TauT family transport system substrate-binding protein